MGARRPAEPGDQCPTTHSPVVGRRPDLPNSGYWVIAYLCVRLHVATLAMIATLSLAFALGGAPNADLVAYVSSCWISINYSGVILVRTIFARWPSREFPPSDPSGVCLR